MTELTIMTQAELQFDKNDIAAIAVAEAEKKMRMTIKELRAQLIDNDKAIGNVEEEIELLGSQIIDVKLKPKLKLIKAGLKVTKIKNFSVELHESIEVFPIDQVESSYPINGYSIHVGIMNQTSKLFDSHICIEKDSLKATQLQITAMKKYRVLKQQKDQLTQDSLDWRRKLGDMPALERQIKAALAKRQIESAKGGKELIQNLLKNFENDLKMLGE
jgi:hypothetical protein